MGSPEGREGGGERVGVGCISLIITCSPFCPKLRPTAPLPFTSALRVCEIMRGSVSILGPPPLARTPPHQRPKPGERGVGWGATACSCDALPFAPPADPPPHPPCP
jgi:hypothetical protein